MTTIKHRSLRRQQGASAVEYALVIALVALVVMGSLTLLATDITEFLGRVGGDIDAVG